MDVSVVGLGKIGLPLAVQAASRGHHVRGVDILPEVVAAVNAGEPPFPGEPDLTEKLTEVVADGWLQATTDTSSAVGASRVVVIVVPLVVDAQARPDFRHLDAASSAVGAALRPGTLVSYETTLPVGTTRGRLAPALAAASGLDLGRDIFVVHSPERVSSGSVFRDLRRYPKLIGALEPAGAERAREFYDEVLEFDERADLDRANGVWDLGSAEAAELTKLAETTYRDVNIAYANELARHADGLGVDVYQVITSANSQPYSHIHRPGIAVGGHCIPVYPRFLLQSDPRARLPTTAREVNEDMPAYAVERLDDALGGLDGRVVVVLGAAYRGGVKETAFSGVFPVVEELQKRSAVTKVHDPLYRDEELRALGLDPFHLGETADAALLQAEHEEYRGLRPSDVAGVRVVMDGRAVLDSKQWPGVTLLRLGALRRSNS